eukprot:6189562-Pleurochrysis_carterae.AAC.1
MQVDAFIRTTLDQEGYHTGTPLNEVLPALGYGVVLKDGSGARTKSGEAEGEGDGGGEQQGRM